MRRGNPVNVAFNHGIATAFGLAMTIILNCFCPHQLKLIFIHIPKLHNSVVCRTSVIQGPGKISDDVIDVLDPHRDP